VGDNGTGRFRVRRLGREARQAFGLRPGQFVDTLQPLHHHPASVLHGQLSVYSDSRMAVIPISEARGCVKPGTFCGRGHPRSELPSSPRPRVVCPPMAVHGTEHGVICSDQNGAAKRQLIHPRGPNK
jgi:hypothetical protein